MVVVNRWSDVLDTEARQRWWSNLAPRLAALTAAGGLSADGYFEYLLRGIESGAPPSVAI